MNRIPFISKETILQMSPGQCQNCGTLVISVLMIGADGYRWFMRLDDCKLKQISGVGQKLVLVDPDELLFEHRHPEHKNTSILHKGLSS